MKVNYTFIRYCFIACCAVFNLTHCFAGGSAIKQLTAEDKKEYEFIQKRFLNPANENLMSAAGWTLIHCANEKEVQGIAKSLHLLGAFVDNKRESELAKSGSIKKLKDNVAELLNSKDTYVRGFGAITLSIIGDAIYTHKIAKLLEDKLQKSAESDNYHEKNWDRSRAAMGLGIMKAKEYAPKISELLQSPDACDRTGAALGLGFMGAKEYINDIAKLLEDNDDQVKSAAMLALGELDAKEYALNIAKLLTSSGSEIDKTACYTLVRLNANKQANMLAEQLKSEFRKGDAAKALALLGAKEYTKEIAVLLEDNEPLVRCDAAMALGILNAKEYAKNISLHLKDKTRFVRVYAAIALLLMNDQANSEEILELMQPEESTSGKMSDKDHIMFLKGHIKLHPVVADKENEFVLQVKKSLDNLEQAKKIARY